MVMFFNLYVYICVWLWSSVWSVVLMFSMWMLLSLSLYMMYVWFMVICLFSMSFGFDVYLVIGVIFSCGGCVFLGSLELMLCIVCFLVLSNCFLGILLLVLFSILVGGVDGIVGSCCSCVNFDVGGGMEMVVLSWVGLEFLSSCMSCVLGLGFGEVVLGLVFGLGLGLSFGFGMGKEMMGWVMVWGFCW